MDRKQARKNNTKGAKRGVGEPGREMKTRGKKKRKWVAEWGVQSPSTKGRKGKETED